MELKRKQDLFIWCASAEMCAWSNCTRVSSPDFDSVIIHNVMSDPTCHSGVIFGPATRNLECKWVLQRHSKSGYVQFRARMVIPASSSIQQRAMSNASDHSSVIYGSATRNVRLEVYSPILLSQTEVDGLKYIVSAKSPLLMHQGTSTFG